MCCVHTELKCILNTASLVFIPVNRSTCTCWLLSPSGIGPSCAGGCFASETITSKYPVSSSVSSVIATHQTQIQMLCFSLQSKKNIIRFLTYYNSEQIPNAEYISNSSYCSIEQTVLSHIQTSFHSIQFFTFIKVEIIRFVPALEHDKRNDNT